MPRGHSSALGKRQRHGVRFGAFICRGYNVRRLNLNDMRFQPRISKYNNKPVVVDGHHFPSRREANRYAELKLMERAGLIAELKLQVPFPITINTQVVTRYVADFTYKQDGKIVVEDCKGFKTDTFKLKAKMVKAQYGVVILET